MYAEDLSSKLGPRRECLFVSVHVVLGKEGNGEADEEEHFEGRLETRVELVERHGRIAVSLSRTVSSVVLAISGQADK